jgi:hypothetical protein
MQTEANSPPESRYLMGVSVVRDRELSLLQSGVIEFMKKKTKDNAYQRYMHWEQATNEIAVLTAYAYADIPLPKTYDTIFHYRQPANVIHVTYTLTQAVFNGWMAIEELSHGHKHVIIIQFPDGIPPICDKLPAFRVGQGWDLTAPLGFSNFQDYAAICQHLTRT